MSQCGLRCTAHTPSQSVCAAENEPAQLHSYPHGPLPPPEEMGSACPVYGCAGLGFCSPTEDRGTGSGVGNLSPECLLVTTSTLGLEKLLRSDLSFSAGRKKLLYLCFARSSPVPRCGPPAYLLSFLLCHGGDRWEFP